MSRVISGIVLALLIAGGTVGCSSGSPNAAPQPQANSGTPGPAPQKPGAQAGGAGKVVSASPVVQGQVKLTFTYSGTLQSSFQVSVAPKSSGRVEKLMVDVGSQVKTGDTIATLERNTLQLAVQQSEANLNLARAKLNQVRTGATSSDLQAAQTALDKARADLASNTASMEKLKNGSTQADLAAAQASVDSYNASVKSYQAALDQLKAGPTQADISSAQRDVVSAKSSLVSAEDRYQAAQNGNFGSGTSSVTSNSAAQEAYDAAKAAYDAAVQKLQLLQAGPTTAALQAAQSSLDSAKANYNAAVAKLNQMKGGPTPQDLQQSQSLIDKSQADINAYQAKLDQLKNGPTTDDLAIAQAGVDVAEAALATAKTNLADATLVAPFDGIVTQKLVSPGALVSVSTPVVTLLGADLEIPVSVEESRLAQLKPGLPTAISVPAYAGESFGGKVVSIAPSADSKSHTFSMKVVPEDSKGKLKPGMFADIKVTAEQRNDALLVPRDAVTQRSGKDVLFVIVDGKAQMRQVVQGIPSDGNVEIVSGVKAGEQVAVVGLSGLNDGDSVRVAGNGGGQPSNQQQQPGAPGKSQQPGSSGQQQPQQSGGQQQPGRQQQPQQPGSPGQQQPGTPGQQQQ